MSRKREDPRGISKDGFRFHEVLRHRENSHNFRIFIGIFLKNQF